MDVLQLDVFVKDESEELIFDGAQKVLEKLRPEWKQKEIQYKMLTDGITNKLVKCSFLDEDIVLIRIYGNKTDLFIDRKAETRNIQMLSKFALAPKLFAVFCNGLAYEYVPGCTLTTKTVREPNIFNLVARHMAKLHKVRPEVGKSKEAMLWRKLDSFLKLVPETFSKNCIQKKFVELNITKQQICVECKALRTRLESLKSPIVFCHNDLLLGNVIHTENQCVRGEDSQRVTFIDFEYADWNYQAYDIGNHFAEFAGVENVDYDKYPCKELQMQWLRVYANEFYGESSNCSERHLEQLYVAVNQFALASHLLWGVWALIQAENARIDFDFIEYSSIRFKEYFRKKDEFLSLRIDE